MFTEATTVQQAIVDRLASGGWTHIPGASLSRPLESALVESDLRAAIIRINPSLNADATLVDDVITKIRTIIISTGESGLMAANEQLTAWARGRQSIQLASTGQDEPIHLIDFANVSNNTFVVSDEVTFGVPGSKARFDIVLWVNGLPLVVGETKTPVDNKKSWIHAAKDIRDVYEVERPHFFVPNLLSFATEGHEFRYAAIRTPIDFWAKWGSTATDANLAGWDRVKLSIDELLAPATILSLLSDYALYERDAENRSAPVIKIVPRYFQVETVEAILNRVAAGTPRKGLIYHTQGSGKTLAMAWAAARLINDPRLKNPTIVAIADRTQLVRQTYSQFRDTGATRLTVARTSEELRTALSSNQRGVIFTTIHKFSGAGLLSANGDIVVLVDEAHRTQEGTLGAQMRAAVPNAFFFGFTGTPIADLDRNTFALFGYEGDPGHALNAYDSDRSIADGTTVPMRVSSRMIEFAIDQEKLETEFLEFAVSEDLDDGEMEEVAARLSTVATLLANPERIRAVCSDILDHFYSTVDPLAMKAQIVVYNRALCVAYHEQITELLAERGIADEAALVMSALGKDDPTEWDKHKLTDAQEETLLNRFRTFGDPLKFIIVTAKLGTGFNAPIEGVLYLDKPLKLHTLFQTITRTNRPWSNPETKQKKAFGLVVDYIGLGNGFARAMTPNNPDKKQREIDIDGMLEAFLDEFVELLTLFAGLDRTDNTMDGLYAAVERVPSGSIRDEFALSFMFIQTFWETLSPHPALFEHRDDYRWLASIYQAVTPSDDTSLLWDRVGAKTLALVYSNITDISVRNPRVTVQIADSTTVQNLIAGGVIGADDEALTLKPIDEIIDSIETRLRRRMTGPNGDHIAFRGLSDRLERLRKSELARAKDSIEYLRELFTVAKDLREAERAEDQDGGPGLDLLPNPHLGALTQIFEEYKPADVPVVIGDIVAEIDRIVKQVSYPGWTVKDDGKRTVRKNLLQVFRKFKLPLSGEPFESAYRYVEMHY
ncbi:HsdR family type I site-specific deoxyribonuclease [Cryobacterium sp. SO2]|uniref:type I restriction endonuclease subunit R n=1 Tax=Cryobacterium sp. SO2 TaxID=1897060 RepID=UPI00223D543A|nr:HsdR family type I site-specific deoxyribonuclease [Cryobacterium sp. SO2]WEO76424.1 HsdR family type I site-specific deoxyribonuclease [Cryobacterium sp. SO2]